MNTLSRAAAVGGALLIAAMAASPALAAPVDKATFDAQLKAAVTKAQVAPKGMAVLDTQVMTVSKPAMKMTASRTVNPDKTSVSKTTFLGKSETRCVTTTKCYTSANGGKTWTVSKPTDKGVTRVDDTLAYYGAMKPSSAATFDVSGNTFTMTDETVKMVTVVSGSTVTTTVDLKNPKVPSETATMVIKHQPTKVVKVVTPTVGLAKTSGSPSQSARTTGS